METSEIRRANLQRLVATYPTQTAFAHAIARELDQVGHLLSGRKNIGAQLARHIETSLGLTNGSLSQLPLDQIGQYNPAPDIDHNQNILELITSQPLKREDAAAVLHLIKRLSS